MPSPNWTATKAPLPAKTEGADMTGEGTIHTPKMQAAVIPCPPASPGRRFDRRRPTLPAGLRLSTRTPKGRGPAGILCGDQS